MTIAPPKESGAAGVPCDGRVGELVVEWVHGELDTLIASAAVSLIDGKEVSLMPQFEVPQDEVIEQSPTDSHLLRFVRERDGAIV